jgi:energy-coupling factor transport system permease protein
MRLKKAQESRGVDFEHGKITKRIRAIFSLIIPLFISTFSRSTDLAEALEVRGYVPNAKRTRYSVLHFSYRDIVSFLFISAVSAGFYTLSYYQFDILGVLFNFSNAITTLGA